MFDMGFIDDIKDILKHVNDIQKLQVLLFSATTPT